MDDAFKIYVDRLKSGETQKVQGAFDPSFLEIDEQELQFEKPVAIKAEVYIAEDHLVIHLDAATYARMPCAICNAFFDYPLSVSGFYATEPLAEIPSAIADLGQYVREALLPELPKIAECSGGKCTAREKITPFLRSEKREQTTYFPFADMDQKN